MPKHKINWINDHTQICDCFDERVQCMQDYLNSKIDDFDGIAVNPRTLDKFKNLPFVVNFLILMSKSQTFIVELMLVRT